MINGTCIPCLNDDITLYYASWILMYVFFFIYFFVSLYCACNCCDCTEWCSKCRECGDDKALDWRGRRKIILTYLQIFNNLEVSLSVKFPFPQYVQLITNIYDFILTFNFIDLSVLFQLCNMTTDYYVSFGWYMATPVVFYFMIIISSLLAVCCVKRNHRKIKETQTKLGECSGNQKLKDEIENIWIKAKARIVFYSLLFYPTLISKISGVHDCKTIINEKYFNFDLDQECYHGKHLELSHWSYLFLSMYVIGIPFAFFCILYCAGTKREDEEMKEAYGELYGELEKDKWWWEVIIEALRKVLLVGIPVLFPTTYQRVLYCACCQLIYNSFATYVKPFEKDEDDKVNSIAAVQLVFTTLIGFLLKLMENDQSFTSNEKTIYCLLIIITNLIVLILGFKQYFGELFPCCKKVSCCKNNGTDPRLRRNLLFHTAMANVALTKIRESNKTSEKVQHKRSKIVPKKMKQGRTVTFLVKDTEEFNRRNKKEIVQRQKVRRASLEVRINARNKEHAHTKILRVQEKSNKNNETNFTFDD